MYIYLKQLLIYKLLIDKIFFGNKEGFYFSFVAMDNGHTNMYMYIL